MQSFICTGEYRPTPPSWGNYWPSTISCWPSFWLTMRKPWLPATCMVLIGPFWCKQIASSRHSTFYLYSRSFNSKKHTIEEAESCPWSNWELRALGRREFTPLATKCWPSRQKHNLFLLKHAFVIRSCLVVECYSNT